MGKYEPSERTKNEEYKRGYEDAKAGRFNPPKGDWLVDTVFAPIDYLTGSPNEQEMADGKSPHYRAGHAAGSHSKK